MFLYIYNFRKIDKQTVIYVSSLLTDCPHYLYLGVCWEELILDVLNLVYLYI